MDKTDYIVHKLKSSCMNTGGGLGNREASKIEFIGDTKSGEAYIEVSKTITERYSLKDFDKANQLYEDLNRGGGRKLVKLKELTK